MRNATLFSLILLFCVPLSLFGQEKSGQNVRYETNYPMRIFMYDPIKAQPNFNEVDATGPGWDFFISSEKQTIVIDANNARPEIGLNVGNTYEFYIVYFPKWSNSESNPVLKSRNDRFVETEVEIPLTYENITDENGDSTRKIKTSTKEERQVFWCVRASDINEQNTTRIHKLSWAPTPSLGTVVFPVKLRPGNKRDSVGTKVVVNPDSSMGSQTITREFDFSTDVTLGTTYAARWRISKTREYFINAIFAAGITSVSLDSSTTNGAVQISQKAAAFTLAGGAVFEFEGGQLGVFWGHDFLGRGIGDHWHYNKKGWVGVGIGVNIFNRNTASQDQGGKQKDGK